MPILSILGKKKKKKKKRTKKMICRTGQSFFLKIGNSIQWEIYKKKMKKKK